MRTARREPEQCLVQAMRHQFRRGPNDLLRGLVRGRKDIHTLKAVMFLLVFLIFFGTVAVEQHDGTAPAELPSRGTGKCQVIRSAGDYLEHKWHVDEKHLLWWDGKPYVRFGFTGNGNLAQMRRLGFDQFTLTPAEAWAISGPDEVVVRSMDETTAQLEKAGATYYAGLNALWPWRYGNLIAEADKAAVFVRDTVDVTEHAGRREALNLEVRMPIHRSEHEKAEVVRTLVLLSQNDYRGFNRFLMNPSARAAAREVEWIAELRREIVDRVVQSK